MLPPLLIGIGGGGKEISRGLPLDVLNMVLTAEQIRRNVGLGECRIICADDAVLTNVGRRDGFTAEKVQKLMRAKRELLKIVVEQLGISDHFLGSEINTMIGAEEREVFNTIVGKIRSPCQSSEYFVLETAQMYTLVGQGIGGIKIGWFNRRTTERDNGAVLDELPFDHFYSNFCIKEELRDGVSFIYVHAGVNLNPGHNNEVKKECPYVVYDSESRLLLHPDDDIETRLNVVLSNQSIPAYKSVKRHYNQKINRGFWHKR